jgi:hypothetical protein
MIVRSISGWPNAEAPDAYIARMPFEQTLREP